MAKRRKSYNRKSKEIDAIWWLILFISLIVFSWYNWAIKPNIEKIKNYWLVLLGFLIFCIILYIILKIIKRRKRFLNGEDKLLNDLLIEIKGFKPLRNYNSEQPYQVELAGFLKKTYPNLNIEETKWFARPDILVEDIAIEIKWPTTEQWLATIADKIMKYLKYRNYIVIVLFNVKVNESYYNEWKDLINSHFNHCIWKVFIIKI